METFTLPQHELTHQAARSEEHVLLEGHAYQLWPLLGEPSALQP